MTMAVADGGATAAAAAIILADLKLVALALINTSIVNNNAAADVSRWPVEASIAGASEQTPCPTRFPA